MSQNKSQTFVVAVDGSSSSSEAFHYTLEHSTPQDKIILTTGVQHKTVVMTNDLIRDPSKIQAHKERLEHDNQHNVEKAKELLTKFQTECKNSHRQCSIQALPIGGGASAVGESLCQIAENNHATLVMGSRGLSQIERVLLGSISDYCVRNCNTTVTVVKGSNK